jgi:hypothetical protein
MKLNKTTKLAIAAAILAAVVGPSMAFASQDKNPTPTAISSTVKPDKQ